MAATSHHSIPPNGELIPSVVSSVTSAGPASPWFIIDPCHSQDIAAAAIKRKQVKQACINCRKACKKCEEQRPCCRCARLGLAESCVDWQRKPREKGHKRGPYFKKLPELRSSHLLLASNDCDVTMNAAQPPFKNVCDSSFTNLESPSGSSFNVDGLDMCPPLSLPPNAIAKNDGFSIKQQGPFRDAFLNWPCTGGGNDIIDEDCIPRANILNTLESHDNSGCQQQEQLDWTSLIVAESVCGFELFEQHFC